MAYCKGRLVEFLVLNRLFIRQRGPLHRIHFITFFKETNISDQIKSDQPKAKLWNSPLGDKIFCRSQNDRFHPLKLKMLKCVSRKWRIRQSKKEHSNKLDSSVSCLRNPPLRDKVKESTQTNRTHTGEAICTNQCLYLVKSS